MSPETLNGVFALGGAAIGAVIAGLFTWRAAVIQAGKRILVCDVGRPEDLIRQTKNLDLPLEVFFAGHKLEALQRQEITIFNAGNRAIEHASIEITIPVHRPVFVAVPSDKSIIEHGHLKIVRKIKSRVDVSALTAEINYLNPDENFSLIVYYEGEIGSLDIAFRSKEVEFRKISSSDSREATANLVKEALIAVPGGRLAYALIELAMPRSLKVRS